MPESNAFDLETTLREQLKDHMAPGCCLHIADREFWWTPLHDVVDLLNRERIDKLEFHDEKRDCDDFALLLHAAMVRSQRGNPGRRLPHAFGQVWGMQDGVDAHAINIMVNSDGAVRFIEPQARPDEAVKTVAESGLTHIWMIRM